MPKEKKKAGCVRRFINIAAISLIIVFACIIALAVTPKTDTQPTEIANVENIQQTSVEPHTQTPILRAPG